MAAAVVDEITLLELNHIFPAPNGSSIGNKSFPLSCLDIPWLLPGLPMHSVFFYELPHSKSHLIQTTIPILKNSLSITLQHFFPLAGNLVIFPFSNSSPIPTKPEIRYVEGDSVSFTVAESKEDFIYLTGRHARKTHELYPLVPKLRAISRDSNSYVQVPLLALQVTIFPNHGICIGVTSYHVVGDASTFTNFLRAWASVTKFGNDKHFLATGSLPFFDKSFIKDPNGMDTMIWSHVANTWSQESPPVYVYGENDKVQASFIITNDQINQVKKSILANRPTIARVSSFVIVCAHVWTCLAKVRNAIGKQIEGMDENEQFGCVLDCRAHFDPPIPKTYFGNCLVPLQANAKRNQLFGKEGFFYAVELIGDAILARLKSMESIDACFGIWMEDLRSLPPTSSLIRVAGSPKFDIYDTDFGWGKLKKFDMVSTYNSRDVSLNTSRESKLGTEISLSLTKIQMDVFETIFTNNLKILQSNPLVLSKI